jgi:hypothetical protein
MFYKTDFSLTYAPEGFCRACFNWWKHCDCVGDLIEDVGNGFTEGDDTGEGGGDGISEPDSSVQVVAVNPNPPNNPTGVPIVSPDPSPAKGQKRPPPSKGQHEEDMISLGSSGDTPDAKVPKLDFESSLTGARLPDDVPQEITLYPPPDYTSLTPEEVFDLAKDGIDNMDVPDGLNFNVPTLAQLGAGYKPYSQSRVPVAEMLQGIPSVPQYYGVGNYKGTPTREYTQWYKDTFVPWYFLEATPEEKVLLQGVECIEPGPDLGYKKWLDLPDIYLNKISGKEDKYVWDRNGKTYFTTGKAPSRLQMWFPEKFPFLKGQDLQTRSTRSTVTPRELRMDTGLPVYASLPVEDDKQYIFPDAFNAGSEDYDSTVIAPPPPPPPVLAMTPVTSTVESGLGTSYDILYGKRLTNPNCWKFMTYQCTGKFGSNLVTLQCGQAPLVFFNTQGESFMDQGGTPNPYLFNFYIYNHMIEAPIQQMAHAIVRIHILVTNPQNATTLNIAAFAADGTTLPITLNFPRNVADIQYAASTPGVYSTSLKQLEVGVYITPQQNLLFTNNTPYLRLEVSCRDSVSLQGTGFRFTATDTFRNPATLTPGLQIPVTDPSVTDFNQLGTNYKCSSIASDTKLNELVAASNVNGQDIKGLFSKLWINPVTNTNLNLLYTRTNGQTVSELHAVVTPSNSIWRVIPLIGVMTASGQDVKSVLATNATGNQSCIAYRKQHVNIYNY